MASNNGHAGADHAPSNFDLTENLLLPLLRGWRSIAVATVLGGALGYGLSWLQAPIYAAHVTVLPPQASQSAGGAAASAIASLGASAGIGTSGGKGSADQYAALLQSDTVRNHLIDRFKLMEVYGTTYRESALKLLAKRTVVTPGKKDGLITIVVEDTDPARAAAMANRHVDELRDLTSHLSVSEAQQRRAFFEHQLLEVKKRLTAAQAEMQGSGISESTLKAEPKSAAESFAKLRSELTTNEVRLQALRIAQTDDTPEVQRQLATVQALRRELAQLNATQKSESGPDYVSKYREYKYQETLFDIMARQYELARVDEAREGMLFQIVDPAVAPERKLRPQRMLMGLVVGALAALFWMVRIVIKDRLHPERGDRELRRRMQTLRDALKRR